ncbi:MAG: fold metallo-hydrolase [Candidatus Saccharibacteria bacterium]|nr:fold metallo-hydrolase [Candidatus Saccharibacteria bacterium]
MDQGSILFIGTATTLIRYGSFAILTDPNFLHQHEEVHLGYGLRSKRLTQPAIELNDLPPLDLVILSHFHEDHFDRGVQQRLDKSVPIVTTPKAAHALRKRGFENAVGIMTWQSKTVIRPQTTLTITATPGRHGPRIIANLLPEVMGSILEFKRADKTFKMYITGDTLVYDQIKEIPKRYPGIDLALLHLGGTKIMGIMVTMDGRQGVKMLEIVHPKLAIPIHYNDYTVFKSPLSDFQNEVAKAEMENHVHYMNHGDEYIFEI